MKRSKIISRVLTAIILLILTATATFAWIAKIDEIDPNLEQATVIKQYFHTGSGEIDDPYVITRPIHYYNLVQLYQRTNGFMPKEGEENEPIYFQLGYNLDGDESNGLEVFNYDDDGKPTTVGGQYSKELNMEFFSGNDALLPIGTSEIPFEDIFDGSFLTIKNLHIKATQTVGETIYGTSDVGIFGYVTADAEIKNTYFNSFVIDLAGTDPEKTVSGHNINPHDSNEDGTSDLVYVGYIAGHVKTTTTIEHVYINNCKIIGGNAAKCKFGYFGCVENEDGSEVPALGDLIATLHTSGDDSGFGGSIDMKNILNRLGEVFTHSEFKTTYGSLETITINERSGSKTFEMSNYEKLTFKSWGTSASGTTGQNGGTSYNSNQGVNLDNQSADGSYYFQYRYYNNSDYSGAYYFYDRNLDDYRYELIGGESSLNKKNVITFTYKDNEEDAWFIKDNDVYLTVNGLSLTTSSSEENATKWIFEETSGGFYVYAYLKTDNLDTITKYYLNKSGTYGLNLSSTRSTIWQKSDIDHLYTTVGTSNYYLDYMNEWRVTPYFTTYYLSSGTNNYLSNNNTSIINSNNENSATRWVLSNPSGNTYFYTVINDNIYYLNCNGTLLLGTSNTTTWTKEGNGYFTEVSGIRYDLIFDGTNWRVAVHSGKKLNDGNNHYLTAIKNGNNVTVSNTASEADAVVWQFTNDSGNTKIYTLIDGNMYYLTYSNGLVMAQSSGITWNRDVNTNSFYYDNSGTNYYLTYDDGWTVQKLQYMTINDGNGNYLKVDGANSFSNTNASGATHFYSDTLTSQSSTGSIYCIVGGTTYYLYNNAGVLATSTSANTTWQNDGSGSLKVNGSNWWLDYSSSAGKWGLVNNKTYYYITSGNYYLTVNESNNNITNNVNSAANATKWVYSGNKLSNAEATSTKYLGINPTTSGGGCGGETTTTYNLQYNNTSNNTWTYSNSRLSMSIDGTTVYLYINNGRWSGDTSSSNITMNSQSADAYVGEAVVTPTPSIALTNISNNPSDVSLTQLDLNPLNFTATIEQELIKSYVTNKNGGYNTYFPIKLATTDEGSWYDSSDPYKVSMKNTGYIIGGNRVIESTQNSFQKSSGDIRISYFPIYCISDSYPCYISYQGNYLTLNNNNNGVTNSTSIENATLWSFTFVSKNNNGTFKISTEKNNTKYYISTSNNGISIGTNYNNASSWYINNNNYLYNGSRYLYYNNGWTSGNNGRVFTYTGGSDFKNIYTVNDSGTTQKAKETDAFTEAKRQLLETLSGSNSVYGLHFMDAEISKDHLVTASKAVVLGREYDNYEMPLDSIDFHVIDRGTINFFAGNYFTDNNTFFSLHKIIRDENNDIDKILEIIEVYEKTNTNQNYIYKFSDGTYSNENGSYTGATSLAAGYNTTPVFKTEWITVPGISQGYNLYYFEIPCNAGEYCLGSVSGKTGAYLAYLDIASNGGEAINNVISAEGNTITQAFSHVEYRDRPDKLEEDGDVTGKSLLQLAFNAPDGTDKNSFSINVQFISDQELLDEDNYSKGLYVITIVNKSGENVVLDVFLCDDDTITYNDYDYAYKVVYINETHTTETTLLTLITNKEYFKSMGSFTIPSSGDAVESSYVS